MQNPMTDDLIRCSFCGEYSPNNLEAITEHVLVCEKRPELGLILKIELLAAIGDEVLNYGRALTKVLANLDGPNTKFWESFHEFERQWTLSKEADPVDLAQQARAQLSTKGGTDVTSELADADESIFDASSGDADKSSN